MTLTLVTIVGMAAGAVLILTAVAVFWSKKDFPAGGVMVSMVGLVLIGMSQWSSIKITAGGATIEAVRAEITKTAAAAEEVAAQAQQAAEAVEATKKQLASLTDLLETRQVLPAAAAEPIRARLAAAPNVDLTKLGKARATLRDVITL
jgi:hypothetical protein